MKRLYHLTVSGLNLIHLSGITWLYGILTLIYIVIIMMVNVSWRNAVSSLLIFSDPAAMGLYFMGAVVLLEKSQRVDAYVAITPVKSSEYVFSKVISFCIVSLCCGMLLTFCAGCYSLWYAFLSISCLSMIFTLCGIILAQKVNSLNGFILGSIPLEMTMLVPVIFKINGMHSMLFSLFPSTICFSLLNGESIPMYSWCIVILVIVFLFYNAAKSTEKMWCISREVKL